MLVKGALGNSQTRCVSSTKFAMKCSSIMFSLILKSATSVAWCWYRGFVGFRAVTNVVCGYIVFMISGSIRWFTTLLTIDIIPAGLCVRLVASDATSAAGRTSDMDEGTIWWRHDMKTVSVLLALCERIPLATNGFPSQRASDADLWYLLWC